MSFNKMKKNNFQRLLSIVLVVHTILQHGLIVNAASISHKGMKKNTLTDLQFAKGSFNMARDSIDSNNKTNKNNSIMLRIKGCISRTSKRLYKANHFNTCYSIEIGLDDDGGACIENSQFKFYNRNRKKVYTMKLNGV